LVIFKRGIRRQLAALAKRQVSTIAVVDGHVVCGIPKKVGGSYVLDQPSSPAGIGHGPAKR
jgi:hypothetical protein